MEIYFEGPNPRIVIATARGIAARKNVVSDSHNGIDFHIADSVTYEEAISTIIWRSKSAAIKHQAGDHSMDLYEYAYRKVIDGSRGDGFTLLLLPFHEWHEFLGNSTTTPDEYSKRS